MKPIKEIFAEYDEFARNASFEEREDFLIKECKKRDELSPEDTRGRAALYSELASLYRNNRIFDKSEDTFAKAFAIIENPGTTQAFENSGCAACRRPKPLMDISDEYFTDYATILNNYAGLLRLTKRFDEAINAFEKVEKMYNELGDATPSMKASAKNNLALVYMDKKDFNKAEGLFEEALSILLKDAVDAKYEIATTYGNLAVISYNKGLKDKAIEEGKKSIKTFKECVDKNNPALQGIEKFVELMEQG